MSDRSPESTDEEPTHDDRARSDGTGPARQPADGRRIMVPPETVAAIENRLAGTAFESVEAYSVFALESLLRHLETLDDETSTSPTEDHTTESDHAEEIEDRLESLGYL